MKKPGAVSQPTAIHPLVIRDLLDSCPEYIYKDKVALMNLILWRHAEAEDTTPDLKRVLTRRGLKEATLMAQWLHAQLPPGTRVIASPAERTRQTAQALVSDFEIVNALAPGKGVEDLLATVKWPDAGNDHTVLVVGHQPTLGQTAALLIGGAEAPWSIKKGAVWWISHRVRGAGAQAVLRMVMSPDRLL